MSSQVINEKQDEYTYAVRILYDRDVDPVQLALVVVLVIACSLQFVLLAQSRGRRAGQLQSSLLGIQARLDEQARRQGNESRALREELDLRLARSSELSEKGLADISSRLALIDRARQGLLDLSAEVVSLRRVLSDRSARGAFGEVQLGALVQDVLPPGSYRMQCALPNGKRADCVLLLPPPTGMIAIDSKFPLENYRRGCDPSLDVDARRRSSAAFGRDLRKHIEDVARKYIVAGHTCDYAILFVPSEAVFAEIHVSHPAVVELAQKRRVMLTSPTTLMAVLTTAVSMLKDAGLQEHARDIQEHLRKLADDFKRFEDRSAKLATHFRQADRDLKGLTTSARKIATRFRRIDRLDLGEPAGSHQGVAGLDRQKAGRS